MSRHPNAERATERACGDAAPFSVPRRAPGSVMRLARLGSFHPTRLSFMRALLRRLVAERWHLERPLWEIDARGVGRAVYRARGPRRTYSLVAFAHELPDALRSDRVIATAWDATFCLFDGEPGEDDLRRLEANVPKQEAGRVSDRELVLARANRSTRLWKHVVERLAAGEQPDRDAVEAVGYLMRTTAVYGSAKFGTADRALIADRALMGGPFRAEMLSVYLIRAFSVDLVEHTARVAGGARATGIAPGLRRRFGVGNSTGLGMAPFLVTHPVLLHGWMTAREEALARVRALERADQAEVGRFRELLARARLDAARWRSEHPLQVAKLAALRKDLAMLAARVAGDALSGARPWDRLYRWAEDALSLEGQEQLVALLMEPYGALVDELADAMGADEAAAFAIDGAMTVGDVRRVVADHYGWALALDGTRRESRARFWYVSAEKLEPRLGERFEEPGAEYEQPYGIGLDVAAMHRDLASWDDAAAIADFLLEHPRHRHLVRRVQIVARHPFAEIRDNLVAADMLPIDILRCKLSFFGATRFDPRSDRWVRICMYQGAPYPHELATMPDDDWCHPPLDQGAA